MDRHMSTHHQATPDLAIAGTATAPAAELPASAHNPPPYKAAWGGAAAAEEQVGLPASLFFDKNPNKSNHLVRKPIFQKKHDYFIKRIKRKIKLFNQKINCFISF